jgi:hypothetical protein
VDRRGGQGAVSMASGVGTVGAADYHDHVARLIFTPSLLGHLFEEFWGNLGGFGGIPVLEDWLIVRP